MASTQTLERRARIRQVELTVEARAQDHEDERLAAAQRTHYRRLGVLLEAARDEVNALGALEQLRTQVREERAGALGELAGSLDGEAAS